MIGPYAVAPAVTYALAHALWQGALIALLAAAWFAGLRRRTAATRHAVGLACLVSTMVAAVVTFAVYRQPPSSAAVAAAADETGPLLVRGVNWLAVVVPVIWAVGAGVLLARQLGGWRQVVALGERGGALPASWLGRVAELCHALGISRAVTARAMDSGTPFTAHAWRPVIWLPAPLWERLSPDHRDALLGHELAHVRRLDWIWNGVQCALEALLWFHPAVWWLGRRVRQEREHACDDVAVALCGDPIALAEALAVLERERAANRGLVLAARGGLLVQRVRRLLLGASPPVSVPVGLIALLVASAVLVPNIALSRDMLVNLRVDVSTSGPLTPGNYREIIAKGFRSQRYYRKAMDAAGQMHEVYEEDGEPRPIDANVRAWIGEIMAIDTRR